MFELESIAEIAREAGNRILGMKRSGTNARRKEDGTPVTDADEVSNRTIIERLNHLTPDIPIISEENEEHRTTDAQRFWLVDPLDGTREFISGYDDYTVNIALVDSGDPVLGFVLAPGREVMYCGVVGQFAWRQYDGGPKTPITARYVFNTGAVAVVSRSHSDWKTDQWLAKEAVTETVRAGSSLKFCWIAEGSADVYPRLGRTMEWDTAAGHAVLQAAGGLVLNLDGTPLTYGKPGFENSEFIARGLLDS